MRYTLLLLALAGIPSCRRVEARAAQSAPPTALSAVNDSALARFRAQLPPRAGLTGGATTREALVRAFVAALGTRDTATLRTLVLDVGEFAWLYYPTAREALPPYDLPPDLMWFRHEGLSQQGLAVALESLGGRALQYLTHACGLEPRYEGGNRLWGYCRVRLAVAGAAQPTEAGLFGLIIERGGRFKFVSYANQLD
jgi:hypothetical protein